MLSPLLYIVASLTVLLVGTVPGYLMLRLLPLNKEEAIACSLGVTLMVMYLVSLGTIATTTRNGITLSLTLILLSIVAFFLIRKRGVYSFSTASRYPYIIFLMVYFHAVFTAAIIPDLFLYYTTGFAGNDWLGFYEVAGFYSGNGVEPGIHPMSRTPLYYIAQGAFMSLFGSSLWAYQISNALLNTAFFVSVYLLVRRLYSERAALLAMLLLFFSPFIFKNVMHPFSKMLTAYFVVLAVYFYLKVRAGGGRSATDCILCGLFSGLAYLSHQLGLLVMAGMILDYLLRRIDLRLEKKLAVVLPAISVILPWYLWGIWRYGAGAFSSNPPVFQAGLLFWIYSRLHDTFTTFFPLELAYYLYRLVAGSFFFDKFFDSALSFYFHTLPGALSLTITLAVLSRWKKLSGEIASNAGVRNIILVSLVGGVLVHPAVFLYNHGVAMAALGPFIPLLLVLLMPSLEASKKLMLVALGVASEFLITTWAQFAVISLGLKKIPVLSPQAYEALTRLTDARELIGDWWVLFLSLVVLIEALLLLLLLRCMRGHAPEHELLLSQANRY